MFVLIILFALFFPSFCLALKEVPFICHCILILNLSSDFVSEVTGKPQYCLVLCMLSNNMYIYSLQSALGMNITMEKKA